MVIYDLICENNHEFEGWFKNAEDMNSQQLSGMLACPICESYEVRKKVTASKVGRKSNIGAEHQQVATGGAQGLGAETYAHLQKMLGKVHGYIDKNFTDVGSRFAEEALSIHRGEKEAENIRGTASKSELKELADEGVGALPIPPKPLDKDKLN